MIRQQADHPIREANGASRRRRGGPHAGLLAASAEGHGGVLAALIAMMDDTFRPSLTDCHVKRLEDELGANSIKTTGICHNSNLHSAWDTCLVEQAVGTDPMAAADQLEGEIIDADRAAWITTGPVDWANESFTIATASATDYCVEEEGSCDYEAGNVQLDAGEPQKTVTIDAAYMAASTPIIRDRLKRAGVCLAHLLDQTLAP